MLFGLAASVLVLDVSLLLISAEFDSIFETIHSSVDVKFSAHFQTSRVLRSPPAGVNIDNCCRYITVRLLCSYIVTTRLLLSSYDSRAEVRRSFITTTVRDESQVTPQGRHR